MDPIPILLVEDNPGDARLFQEQLRSSSNVEYDVTLADRLATGLERASKGSFSLILLDLTLPDSNGIETFTEIFKCSPRSAIIILTGQDDEELAIRALRLGAQDYLVKGQINADSLKRAIQYGIERKRLESRLVGMHRNQAIGRLTEGLFHNVVNILNGIRLNIELVKANVAGQEADMLQTAYDAADRVLSIFDLLSIFAGNREPQKTLTDLRTVVTEVLTIVRPAVNEHLKIETSFPEASVNILGDSVLLQQVLINLLTNSSDALQANLAEKRDAMIAISITVGESNECILEICDNGSGISHDVRDLVFEPFFTTKANDEGIGLGLATVRRILSDHGGRIELASQSDEDTRFRISLPTK